MSLRRDDPDRRAARARRRPPGPVERLWSRIWLRVSDPLGLVIDGSIILVVLAVAIIAGLLAGFGVI